MTFWEHFLRLLPHKPTHALAALYWRVTRRRVRAINRLRVASADLPFAYDVWIDRIESNRNAVAAISAATDEWASRPRFSVLLYARDPYSPEQLRRSMQSLERQTYPFWTVVGEPTDSVEARLIASDSEYVVPLQIGDSLSEAGLFRFAEIAQSHPGAAILYGDQDELDRYGRRARPWFKPRWNEELFLAQDYLSGAVAIEINLARSAGRKARGVDEVLLAATSQAKGPIVHVPHILCHVSSQDDRPERLITVERHLEPTGAICTAGPFGTVKVNWPLPEELPLVTIIIPTKDKVDLLHACVESVLARTDYDRIEILIVDNASVETPTKNYFRRIKGTPNIRVVDYPEGYNFSAINNFAARQATGSYLCLLNNDTEVLEPAWLTEMMRYAVRAEIGAVGAKLLYEDGSIQHAGVVVGIGGAAGHAHRNLRAQQPGYFRMPHLAHFVSAVTAACLLVEKRKYLSVGGLDEERLAVAFNDVDFCLKLQAAGWRNVYVPHAVLVHHESKSRGDDMAPQHVERYRRELKVLQDRWGTATYCDFVHNPNLDRASETFVLKV